LRQLAPAALMLFVLVMLPIAAFSFFEVFSQIVKTNKISNFNYIWPILVYCSITIPYVAIATIIAFRKAEKISLVNDYFRTFLILHCSYGLGYLAGIFRFLILGKKSGGKNTSLSR